MSKEYYELLPSLKINWSENHPFKAGKGASAILEKCEYQISGDFVVVFQHIHKIVIPLIEISSLEYPYESV